MRPAKTQISLGCRLIRVFAVRMKKANILSYPLSAQRRLWSAWASAQADLSLRSAHMSVCGFCHEVAHNSSVFDHDGVSCNARSKSQYNLVLIWFLYVKKNIWITLKAISNRNFWQKIIGERGGSVVECRTPEREVGGSIPTAAVLCPWARHFTPQKYWLITQEAVAPSQHDWKIVDWDVKPQHKQTNKQKITEPSPPPHTPPKKKKKKKKRNI